MLKNIVTKNIAAQVSGATGLIVGLPIDLSTVADFAGILDLPSKIVVTAAATSGSPAGVVYLTESSASGGTFTAVTTYDKNGSATSGSVTWDTGGGSGSGVVVEMSCAPQYQFIKMAASTLTTTGSALITVNLMGQTRRS